MTRIIAEDNALIASKQITSEAILVIERADGVHFTAPESRARMMQLDGVGNPTAVFYQGRRVPHGLVAT